MLLVLSAVVLITFLTTLEGFWFYGGMALTIFFFVGLRLEVVGLFGLYDKIPLAVVVALVVGPAFYFNRFPVINALSHQASVFRRSSPCLIGMRRFFLSGRIPSISSYHHRILTRARSRLAVHIYGGP